MNADGLSRLYRYEDVLDTEQIEEGNYDTVTATDIRILADKLLLDEVKYQQLIYPTATVNMMSVLPDNEEDQSFEWVQFVSVKEGISRKYELINLINIGYAFDITKFAFVINGNIDWNLSLSAAG